MNKLNRAANREKAAKFDRRRSIVVGFSLIMAMGLAAAVSVPFFTQGDPFEAQAVTVSSGLNTNLGKHGKWEYAAHTGTGGTSSQGNTPTNRQYGYRVQTTSDGRTILEQSQPYLDESGNEVVFAITKESTAAEVWASAIEYATDPARFTMQNVAANTFATAGGSYVGNYYYNANGTAGYSDHKGEYITVRLYTDWTAVEFETLANYLAPTAGTLDQYTGTTSHQKETITSFNFSEVDTRLTDRSDKKDVVQTAGGNFYATYDMNHYNYYENISEVSDIQQMTGHGTGSVSGYYSAADASVYNPLYVPRSAFSYGRINVPNGAYIVLDLNGHTIDRNMTSRDPFYYGQVISVEGQARLEVIDTAASEAANAARIQESEGVYSNIHEGSIKGGNSATDTTKQGSYSDSQDDRPPADYRLQAGRGVMVSDPHDGYIIRHGQKGGGIYGYPQSEFVLHSGRIEGNITQKYGGAGYTLTRSSIVIFDGYIIGNSAGDWGGAFYLSSNSYDTLTMYGGVFYGNETDTNGGALCLARNNYTDIEGGEIAHNSAQVDGGGIWIRQNCTGLLKDVVVRDNTVTTGNGGGICLQDSTVQFNFMGAVQVYDNTKDGAENNIYLPQNAKIIVSGKLLDGGNSANIGVNGPGTTGTAGFTTGYTTHNPGVSPQSYFFSDAGNGTQYTGNGQEVTFGGVATTKTPLAWKLTGTQGAGTQEVSVTVLRGSDEQWYYIVEGQDGRGNPAKIPTISADSATLKFTFGDFIITKVEAFTYTFNGTSKQYTSCEDGESTSSFAVTLAASATASYTITGGGSGAATAAASHLGVDFKYFSENNSMNIQNDLLAAGKPQNISYAGRYAFAYDYSSSGSSYVNPNFTISISQCGIRADVGTARNGVKTDLYYRGTAYEDITEELSEKESTLRTALVGNAGSENEQPDSGRESTIQGLLVQWTASASAPYFTAKATVITKKTIYDAFNGKVGANRIQALQQADNQLVEAINAMLTDNGKLSYLTNLLAALSAATTAYEDALQYYTGERTQEMNNVTALLEAAMADAEELGSVGDGYYIRYYYYDSRQGSDIVDLGDYGVNTSFAVLQDSRYYTVDILDAREYTARVEFANTTVGFDAIANNYVLINLTTIDVKRAEVSVTLTSRAQDGIAYDGAEILNDEILTFNNNSNTNITPVNDDNAQFRYYEVYAVENGVYTIPEGELGAGTYQATTSQSLQGMRFMKDGFTYDGGVTQIGGGSYFYVTGFWKTASGDSATPGAANAIFEEIYTQAPVYTGKYLVTVIYSPREDSNNFVPTNYNLSADAAHLLRPDSAYVKDTTILYWFDVTKIMLRFSGAGANATLNIVDKTYTGNFQPVTKVEDPSTGEIAAPADDTDNTYNSLTVTYTAPSGQQTVLTAQARNYETIKYYSMDNPDSPQNLVEEKVLPINSKTYYFALKFAGDYEYVGYSVDNYTHHHDGESFSGDGRGLYESTYGSADDKTLYLHYTIKPVEVTITGSVTYTYDGTSSASGYFAPKSDGVLDENGVYASGSNYGYTALSLAIKDNETLTSSSGLITQDIHRDAIAGGWNYSSEMQITTSDNTFLTGGYEKGENKTGLGVGLFAFNTGNAKAGTYNLQTANFDFANLKDSTTFNKDTAALASVNAVKRYDFGTSGDNPNSGVLWLLAESFFTNTTGEGVSSADDLTYVGNLQYINGTTGGNFTISAASALTVTIDRLPLTSVNGKMTFSNTVIGTSGAQTYEVDCPVTSEEIELRDDGRLYYKGNTKPIYSGKGWEVLGSLLFAPKTHDWDSHDQNNDTRGYSFERLYDANDPAGKGHYTAQFANNVNASVNGGEAILTATENYSTGVTNDFRGSITVYFSIAPAEIELDVDGATFTYNGSNRVTDFRIDAITNRFTNVSEYPAEMDGQKQVVGTLSGEEAKPLPSNDSYTPRLWLQIEDETKGKGYEYIGDTGEDNLPLAVNVGDYRLVIIFNRGGNFVYKLAEGVEANDNNLYGGSWDAQGSLVSPQDGDTYYENDDGGTQRMEKIEGQSIPYTIVPAVLRVISISPTEVSYTGEAFDEATLTANFFNTDSNNNALPQEGTGDYWVTLHTTQECVDDCTAIEVRTYYASVHLKEDGNFVFQTEAKENVYYTHYGYSDGESDATRYELIFRIVAALVTMAYVTVSPMWYDPFVDKFQFRIRLTGPNNEQIKYREASGTTEAGWTAYTITFSNGSQQTFDASATSLKYESTSEEGDLWSIDMDILRKLGVGTRTLTLELTDTNYCFSHGTDESGNIQTFDSEFIVTEDARHTIRYESGLAAGSGTISGGTLPYENAGNSYGQTVNLADSYVFNTADGVRYTLVAWTLQKPEHDGDYVFDLNKISEAKQLAQAGEGLYFPMKQFKDGSWEDADLSYTIGYRADGDVVTKLHDPYDKLTQTEAGEWSCTTVFYAVWAVDTDSTEVADWEEEYTVQYDLVGSTTGELVSGSPQNPAGTHEGKYYSGETFKLQEASTGRTDNKYYWLKVNETNDEGEPVENNYVLYGWTPNQLTTYLAPNLDALVGIYNTAGAVIYKAGVDYTVNTADAKVNLSIHSGDTDTNIVLYAVWVLDNQKSGDADFNTANYTVLYEDTAAGSETATVMPLPFIGINGAAVATQNGNMPVPTVSGNGKKIISGKNYLFLGWTVNYDETGEEYSVDTSEEYGEFTLGTDLWANDTVYRINAGHDESSDGKLDFIIHMHAVWGIDLNDNGVPDWDDPSVSVTLENKVTDGNVDGFEFPQTMNDLLSGTQISLPGYESGYTVKLVRNGVTYLLVGFTTKNDAAAYYFLYENDYSDPEAQFSGEFYSVRTPYTVPSEDATLYAVWASDQNGNNVPDYDETPITITYQNSVEGAVSGYDFPGKEETLADIAVTVPGLTGSSYTISIILSDGTSRKFMLIGWTTSVVDAELYLYAGTGTTTPQGSYDNFTAAGGTFASHTDVTLYAVWAEDANGNNIPDYLEHFTVKFDKSASNGTVQQNDNNRNFTDRTNLSLGQSVPLYRGAKGSDATLDGWRILVGETHYVLIGWTLTRPSNPLCANLSDLSAISGVFSAYTVNAADANGLTITLYAVWGIDFNNDYTPDWEGDYRLQFENLAGGDITGGLPTAIPVIDRQEVNLSSYQLVMELDGTQYILLGWTLNETLGNYLYDAQPSPAPDLLPGTYTVQTELADDRGSIHLYAVWGIDRNKSGKVDWEDDFTLTYENEAEGSLSETLPATTPNLKLGQRVPLTTTGKIWLTRSNGEKYVLLGWTLTSGLGEEGYLFKDGAPTFTIFTSEYPVNAADADSLSNIYLYAVWAIDQNGDGKPDYNVEYDVLFHHEATGNGATSGGTLPADRTNLSIGDRVEYTDRGVSLQINGGKNYILLGWTFTSGTHLYESDPGLTFVHSPYTVAAGDADTLNDIHLYAVWGVDQNHNNIPDWQETLTVVFVSTAEGEIVPALPASRGVSVGDVVTVGQNYRLTHNGSNYMLLGFTLSSGVTDPAFDTSIEQATGWRQCELTEFPYTVRAEDAVGSTITFYAIWAVDDNGNNTPDYLEQFTVIFVDKTDPIGGVPSTVTDLSLGASLADQYSDKQLPGGLVKDVYSATESRTIHYVLAGWTTDGSKTGNAYLCNTLGDQNGIAPLYQNDYLISAKDADEQNNIRLYAVWGIDENGDKEPDYRQDRFDIYYVSNLDEAGLTPQGGTLPGNVKGALSGSQREVHPGSVADTYPIYVIKDGVRYRLVGWTTIKLESESLYFYLGVPNLVGAEGVLYPLGAQFEMPAHDVTFYAVWAADNEDDGKGDGTPDYLQEYTVRYAAPEDGEDLTPDDLPYDLRGQKVGTDLVTRSGYAGVKYSVIHAGHRYTIVGWTIEKHSVSDSYLSDALPNYQYYAAGDASDPYRLASADAVLLDGNYTVTLYAVWGIDDNGNGIPDWEEGAISVRFISGLASDPTGFPEDLLDVLAGTQITLGGRDGSSWTVSVKKDGVNYLLVGWTMDADADEYFFKEGAPGGFKAYYEAGSEYTVTGDTVFYAIWAADNENKGEGDDTPDYMQFYTVEYRHAEEGTVVPAGLTAKVLFRLEDQRLGANVNAYPSYILTAKDGTKYALLGWTLTAPTSAGQYLYRSEPEFAQGTFFAKNAGYTVRAEDAVKSGDGYAITLYAVWGIDENGSGTEDWNDTFVLRYLSTVGRTSALPAEDDNGGARYADGASATLKTGLTMSVGNVGYVLIGWTLSANQMSYLCDSADALKLYASGSVYWVHQFKDFTGSGDYPLTSKYTVSIGDSNEHDEILFYAVWAVDDNGNGRPDFEESYIVSFYNGKTTPATDASALERKVGEKAMLPASGKVTADGKTYALLGWTLTVPTADKHLCDDITQYSTLLSGITLYGAGSDYTVRSEDDIFGGAAADNTIYFYAVWGIDSDEDGDPDWEMYNVVFTDAVSANDAQYEISGPVWPMTRYNRPKNGTNVSFEYTEGDRHYSLVMLENGAVVKRYTLSGWTLNGDLGSYLCASESEYSAIANTNDFFAAQNGTISLPADRAKDGVITLYAVWSLDANDNGTSDWNETHYTVVYGDNVEHGAITSVSGGTTALPTESITADAYGNLLLAGLSVAIDADPIGDLRTTADGSSYLFLGWTTGSGKLIRSATERRGVTLYTDLYTVLAKDADAQNVITLYAVWAIDDNDNGNGNQTPDYEEDFTLRYTNEAKGEANPELPLDLTNQTAGTRIYTRTGYTLSADGKRYAIDGWSLKKLSGYLFEGEPGIEMITAGEGYVVSARDAATDPATGEEVIVLYAVWSLDDNGNGTPDYREETYSVNYEHTLTEDPQNFPADVAEVTDGTAITLAGKTNGNYTVSVEREGVKYLLVGWTTDEGEDYFFRGEPTGLTAFWQAGAEYTVYADVTFYAVWAADAEDGGKGDGTPDYLQEYTVRFERPEMVSADTLTPNDLPYQLRGQKIGASFAPHMGYSLVKNGKTYTLVGWTKAGDGKLFYERNERWDASMLIGGEYTVDAADATLESGDYVIRFYGVWAYDENGNGTPDVTERSYTVQFRHTLDKEPALFPDDRTELDGTVFVLAGRDRSNWNITASAGGKQYVLVGWTEEEGEHLFESDPTAELSNFLLAGSEYTVHGNVTLYAVWATDSENNGPDVDPGDKEPDYMQDYLVAFVDESNLGTIKPNGIPAVFSRQTAHSEISTPNGYALYGANNAKYVLVGWSLAALGNYVVSEAPSAATFFAAGDPYTVRAEDASLDVSGEYTITLRAVWAFDSNNNDIPDYREDAYTVVLAAGRSETVTYEPALGAGANDLFSSRWEAQLNGARIALGSAYSSNRTQKIFITVNGTRYVLAGWSTVLQTELARSLPAFTVYKDAYTVSAADANASKVITLYAVWGIDDNNNGIADWEEDRLTVSLVYGETEGIGIITNGTLPVTLLYQQRGAVIDLTRYEDYTLLSDGNNFKLLGWTLTAGDYLFRTERPGDALEIITGSYTVNILDAKDGTQITLYAVWGIDDNDGGNGNETPDYEEEYTVRFENDTGGTLNDDETLPADVVVNGTQLWGDDRATVELPLKGRYSLTLGDKRYVLLGWTLDPGQHVFESEVTIAIISATYLVRSSDADASNVIRLYAVWGMDENGNGREDWNDRFSVTLASGISDGGADTSLIPQDLFGLLDRDLGLGDTVSLADKVSTSSTPYAITVSGRRYVLFGWTTEPGEHLYESLPTDLTILRNYTVSAPDDLKDGAADNNIMLYAIWGVDENASGIVDWEEKYFRVVFTYDARFDGMVAGGAQLPFEMTNQREGATIPVPNGYTLFAEGKNWALIGWTTNSAVSHLFEEAPNGRINLIDDRFTVRADYADNAGTITLYAVWGADENGDGKADFEEAFTVRFVNGAGGSPEGTRPQDVRLAAGELGGVAIELAGWTRLTVAGHTYLLLGWTLEEGAHLFDSDPSLVGLAYMPVGGTFTPVASDDKNGDCVIPLYAVWAIDENGGAEGPGNDVPDWNDELTLKFHAGADGSVTQDGVATNFADVKAHAGDLVRLYRGYTLETNGKSYVLLGWTLEAGTHLCDGLESYFESVGSCFFTYTADVRDADGLTVSLYAVWGIDEDGDNEPDWKGESYRVEFRNASGGTVEGGMPSAVYVREGSVINLTPYQGLTLSMGDGTQHALLGWTTVRGSYLCSGKEAYEALADVMETTYTVDLSAANDDGVITLYAVWGADENGSGKVDWKETYTLTYVNETEGSVSGTLPAAVRELNLGESVALDAVGDLRLTVGGKQYVLYGWTVEAGAHLFADKESLSALTVRRSSYTVLAADADEAGNIYLYAVWVADDNGDQRPDWDEERYEVVKLNGSNLTASEDVFTTTSGLSVGDRVALGVQNVVSVESGGKRYILIGWTLTAGANLYDAAPGVKYFALSQSYTVLAADADASDIIRLYAVWGVDENRNDIPDWMESLTYTVRFMTRYGSVQLPYEVSGLRAGASVDLPDGAYYIEVDGVRYKLYGWTLDENEYPLLTGEPEKVYEHSPYRVDPLDANAERVIVLYGIWGIDANRNDKFDWEERFILRFENRANGVSSKAMPDTITDVPLGTEIPLVTEGYTLTANGKTYVLVGWTTRSHGTYLFDAAPEIDFYPTTYVVNALDAIDTYIFLYAVWSTDENGNHISDYTEQIIIFRDELGYSGDLPTPVSYTPGARVALPDANAREGAPAVFLGWTLDPEQARIIELAPDSGLYTTHYDVPAGARGRITMYAVWGAIAIVDDWIYGDDAMKQVNAPLDNVEKAILTLVNERTTEEISISLSDGNLRDALREALLPTFDAGRYVLSYGGRTIATFNVLPRPLTVKGVIASDKIYDGTTNAEIDVTNARIEGILFEDIVTADFSAAVGNFESANVGTWDVYLSNVVLGGADMGNYVVGKSDARATIKQKEVNIDPGEPGPGGEIPKDSLWVRDKVYDGTTNAEVVLGDITWVRDDLYIESVVGVFEDENVGQDKRVYVTIVLGGENAENFVIRAVLAYADITRAPNRWIEEFALANWQEGEVPPVPTTPKSEWGEPNVRFYTNAACTREYYGSFTDAPAGTYYARVTVNGTQNYEGLEHIYTFRVLAPEPTVDLSLAITLCALQLLLVIIAMIAVYVPKQQQKKKDQKQNDKSAK